MGTIFLQLPIQRKVFGGIIGSRFDFIEGKELWLRVAYLEEGSTPRVRYFEKRWQCEISKMKSQTLENFCRRKSVR